MDKTLIMKILVVAAVLLFITSSIRLPGPSANNNILGEENITGYITFNGTIRTYDPFLLIPSNTNESVLNEVRAMEGVRAVRPGQQGYFIDTETRDDVYPVSSALREMNVSGLSVANIAAPTIMQLQFGFDFINVTTPGVVRVVTEPLLDAGDDVTVTMVGISNNGYLIDYHSQAIQIDTVQLQAEAEVISLDYKEYVYTIPWEERNSIDGTEGDYRKVDTLIFDPPLVISQIIEKKQYQYITYIDAGSAQILSGFDNKSQVLIDFQDTDVAFPDSILTIKTNGTPDIDYEGTVTYSYTLHLTVPEGYEMDDPSLAFSSEEELDETLVLDIEALVAGSRIISVESVSLPS